LGDSILKYAEKYEIEGQDGNISKKIGCLKKIALQMDFGCESYAFLKKDINDKQSSHVASKIWSTR
jgi:hypothetical protein